MRVDSVNPLALSDGDLAAWREWLSVDPQLSSPYFTPDRVQFVARRRRDVMVAVYRSEAGLPVGFLPVQRPNSYAALPVGWASVVAGRVRRRSRSTAVGSTRGWPNCAANSTA